MAHDQGQPLQLIQVGNVLEGVIRLHTLLTLVDQCEQCPQVLNHLGHIAAAIGDRQLPKLERQVDQTAQLFHFCGSGQVPVLNGVLGECLLQTKIRLAC